MKRHITIICNILSSIIIAGQLGIWNALIMFIFIGKIPGIDYSVPPIAMPFVLLAIACGIVAYVYRLSDAEPTPNPSLPKRRYSRA